MWLSKARASVYWFMYKMSWFRQLFERWKISEDFDESENNSAETEQPDLCLITENQLYEASSDYPSDIEEEENEIINRSDIEERDDHITNVLKKPRIM